MKVFKRFCTYLIICCIAISVIPSKTQATNLTVLSETAVIVDGRTLIPLRAVFQEIGATVHWNQSSKTVTATKDNKKIVLKIGSKSPTVNGRTVTIDVPAQIRSERTFVPLRFIAESLGAIVKWNANDQTALIIAGDKNIIVRALPPIMSEKQAKQTVLNQLKSEGYYGIEVKMIYMDDITGMYRVKVGPKNSAYGYFFLYVEPHYGTLLDEEHIEYVDRDEWMYGFTEEDLKYYK